MKAQWKKAGWRTLPEACRRRRGESRGGEDKMLIRRGIWAIINAIYAIAQEKI